MFTVDELFSKRNQRLAFEHLALKKKRSINHISIISCLYFFRLLLHIFNIFLNENTLEV